MEPMHLKHPATSGHGFVVPQLPALPPRFADLALQWPGWAETQQETNPRRQGDLLAAGSAPVLEDTSLIWTPVPRSKEDTSNSWRWLWGGRPLILVMIWLMCSVRLCLKATQVHPCHLLTSEEDIPANREDFQGPRFKKGWEQLEQVVPSCPFQCDLACFCGYDGKHQPTEGPWEQRQGQVMSVSHQIWKCLAPAVGNGTKYHVFQFPLTDVLWTVLAQISGFLRAVSKKLCFLQLFLHFNGVCIPCVIKKYLF